MINTTNKTKKHNGRKQIRLSDLYRYMVTGIVVNINGLVDYSATKSAINIQLVNEKVHRRYPTDNEVDRQNAVREINKLLTEVKNVTL